MALRSSPDDAMAAFNSMPAMSSGAPGTDGMHGMSHQTTQHDLGLQHFDQEINFDEALL